MAVQTEELYLVKRQNKASRANKIPPRAKNGVPHLGVAHRFWRKTKLYLVAVAPPGFSLLPFTN
jgi:hypothetical protein